MVILAENFALLALYLMSSLNPRLRKVISLGSVQLLHMSMLIYITSADTGLHSTIGKESNCGSRVCEFDPCPVPYFFLPLIQEGLL